MSLFPTDPMISLSQESGKTKELSPSIQEIITPEFYLYMTTIVLADAVANIIKPTFCIVCQEQLSEISEGELFSNEKCWYKSAKQGSGKYYCKNSAGTLLTKDAMLTPLSKTPQKIQVKKEYPEESMEVLHAIPFNIFGNANKIVSSSVNINTKTLCVTIALPGYGQDNIDIVLSKSSFNDYQMNIFADSATKGSREISFNFAAELYTHENIENSLSNGLLTILIPKKKPFPAMSLPLKSL